VKNNGDQGVYLSLLTQNWTPSAAADDMQLSWDYDDSTINPDEQMKIILTLVVSSNIQGIDTFAFNIVLVGATTYRAREKIKEITKTKTTDQQDVALIEKQQPKTVSVESDESKLNKHIEESGESRTS